MTDQYLAFQIANLKFRLTRCKDATVKRNLTRQLRKLMRQAKPENLQ